MPTRTTLPNIGEALVLVTMCPSNFAVEVSFDRRWVTATVRGEVDACSAPTLGSMLDAVITAGHRFVAIDIDAVTFMSVAGLRAMVAVKRRLRASDGVLLVRSAPTPVLRRLLVLTGVMNGVPIDADAGALTRDAAADLVAADALGAGGRDDLSQAGSLPARLRRASVPHQSSSWADRDCTDSMNSTTMS